MNLTIEEINNKKLNPIYPIIYIHKNIINVKKIKSFQI